MVDQVSNALGGLANTLRQGLGGIAQQRVDTANLGLQRAELGLKRKFQGLQSKQAEYKINAMRLAEQQAQLQIARDNAPYPANSIFGKADGIAMPDLITKLLPRAQEILGAEFDQENNVFMKPDGTPITQREYKLNERKIAVAYAASIDMQDEFQKQDLRLSTAIDEATRRGDDAKVLELQGQLDDNTRRTAAHEKNPLNLWERQHRSLTGALGMFAGTEPLEGIKAKIANLEGRIKSERAKQTALAKPYTLRPGDIRYGPNGKVIGRSKAKPVEVKVPTAPEARDKLIRLKTALATLEATGTVEDTAGDNKIDSMLKDMGYDTAKKAKMTPEAIANISKLYQEQITYYEGFLPPEIADKLAVSDSTDIPLQTQDDPTTMPDVMDWRTFR